MADDPFTCTSNIESCKICFTELSHIESLSQQVYTAQCLAIRLRLALLRSGYSVENHSPESSVWCSKVVNKRYSLPVTSTKLDLTYSSACYFYSSATKTTVTIVKIRKLQSKWIIYLRT